MSATELAARSARRLASLSAEAEELEDKVGGLTAKAYIKVSDLAVTAVFKGLKLAAEQSAKAKQEGRFETLPEEVQGSAELAARIAMELGSQGPSGSTAEDWGSVALAMAAYTVDTPERTHLLLSLALTILGKDGFALYELEALDPSRLDLTNRFGFHLLRGVVYRMNGFPLLAGLELETAAKLSGQLLESGEGSARAEELAALGPSLLSGVHVLLACYYLDQKELTKADQQIARAIRVWPENPLAVYLTGERLAASGDWEAAAESLERSAAGTDGEYMAKSIAARAREVRDAKGETPPLMSDKRFLIEATLWYVGHAAESSQAAARLKETLDATQEFGQRMLERAKELGGLSGDASGGGE